MADVAVRRAGPADAGAAAAMVKALTGEIIAHTLGFYEDNGFEVTGGRKMKRLLDLHGARRTMRGASRVHRRVRL